MWCTPEFYIHLEVLPSISFTASYVYNKAYYSFALIFFSGQTPLLLFWPPDNASFYTTDGLAYRYLKSAFPIALIFRPTPKLLPVFEEGLNVLFKKFLPFSISSGTNVTVQVTTKNPTVFRLK